MTAKLRTDLGVENPDDFYAQLIEMHEGLSDAESHKLNAKVILMLANHIGDAEVLNETLTYAREKSRRQT